jgi:hypothetical protein
MDVWFLIARELVVDGFARLLLLSNEMLYGIEFSLN